MSYVTPWFFGAIWDTCYLSIDGSDLLPLPGAASLHLRIRNVLKTAQAQGTDVPPVVNKGRDPKRFTLTLRITSQTEFNALQDTVKKLNLDVPGKTFTPYNISHPQATIWGIKQVVIEDVSVQQPDAQSQYVVTMGLVEYGKPVQSLNGPPLPPGATNIVNPNGGVLATPQQLQQAKDKVAAIQNGFPNMDTSDLQKRIQEQDALKKKLAGQA